MAGGRPTKFCQEVADKILDGVRNGLYLHVAAAAAGVGRSTVNRWINRGKRTGAADAPFRKFREGYMESLGEARKRLEECVNKAAVRDPDMALKVLERLYPQDWGTHKNELRRLRELVADLQAKLEGGSNGSGGV